MGGGRRSRPRRGARLVSRVPGGAAFPLAVLVGGLTLATPGCRRAEETITAASETLEALREERAELLGRPLTPDEEARLAEDWIDQEVLVREAYRLGLDRGDGVVRHRLVEKMRALLREKLEEPGPAELEAYCRSHEQRYRSAERRDVDQVFFDRETPRSELEARLAALRGGADFRKMGQRFWLGQTLRGTTKAELGRILGGPFASAVFELPPGGWTGPLESARGLHLLRVSAQHPSELAPYADVSGRVREDWYEEQERASLRRQLVEIKKRYRIETRPEARPLEPQDPPGQPR